MGGTMVILISFFLSLCWAARPIADYIDIESKFIFAAVGFDNNDEVMVILDGYLPNTCYRLSVPVIEGLGNEVISIQARAYAVAEQCLPFPVPFSQEVRLGQLSPRNSYEVRTNRGALKESLSVGLATPGSAIDERLYGSVENVEVTLEKDGQGKTPIGRRHWVTVRGRLSSNCLRLKELKATTTNGKSVEVLPLLERLEKGPDGSDCRYEESNFSSSVPLPTLSLGRHLVHVRSSGGQAVNRVFTNLVAN